MSTDPLPDTALQELERYRNLFHNAVEGIFQSTPDGRYLLVNPALARMYGYESPAELTAAVENISHNIYVDPGVREEFLRLMNTHGEVRGLEYQVRRKDGSTIWISEHARAVHDARGIVLYFEGFIKDITPRKHVEEQLRQSQKMDAVGQLAGGVAHDFNNILTAILGYAELLQRRATDEHARRHVDEIQKNTHRAAGLCRQLLAFSRKQALQPQVLDLNAIVTDTDRMLRRLIGENIQLVTLPGDALPRVKADRGQLEQVLLNLAVNARDAMPDGGTLTIETSALHLDLIAVAKYPELPAGEYVVLAVTDTGIGMTPEVKCRIFEPFFTTKAPDKGTGLGLATCYGIVKQTGGHITVYSEPGKGTTFRVYLPAVYADRTATHEIKTSPRSSNGTEIILLAEDEPSIRELATDTLRELGYTVLPASNGMEAMRLAQQRGCRQIDLLLTDVVMPEMGGKELAYWLRTVSPETRVLFTSGYTNKSIVRSGALNPGTSFLQKPYPLSVLAQTVRHVLDN